MGFADSGTSVSIANPADLATAIGADTLGQAVRLVDNRPVAYASGVVGIGTIPTAPVAILTKIDVSRAVMVAINLDGIIGPLGATSLATAPVGIIGFDMQLDWYDPTGTVILYSEAYEITTGPTPPIGQSTFYGYQAIIPARGALLTITATNPLASAWPTNAGGRLLCTVNTSSRPVPPGLRSYIQTGPITPTPSPFDGLLIDRASGTLAASGQVFLLGLPAVGDVFLTFLGATTQMRFDVGWGCAQHGLLRDVRTWAAINNPSAVFGPFPATNRPLSVQIVNVSTTTGCSYNVSAWARGVAPT